MNLGDLNKVREIKTLKRKPKEEEARKILDRVAKQVQPIMRKHNWMVKLLSEFCPKNRALLGLNVGGGIHIKLRLRRPDRDEEFLPFHEVLDTMLHELCHNVHGPHNASFYKLWEEIRKECEELINKGITGSGQGLDLPGRCLDGISLKHLHSSLRQVALTATENRARLGSLLPSRPKRVGGDSSIMVALSPVQAAAMAAERRLQDNIWCGSESSDVSGEDECTDSLPKSSDKGCSEYSNTVLHEYDMNAKSWKRSGESDGVSLLHSAGGETASTFIDLAKTVSKDESVCYSDEMPGMKAKSQKRSRELDDVSLPQSADNKTKSTFIDLTKTDSKYGSTCYSDEMPPLKNHRKDLRGAASSSSISTHDLKHNNDFGGWQCAACTLLNPPLAPICGVCRTQKPKDDNLTTVTWSCRFCTMENDVKTDKCALCGSWRYSYGPPVASAPNLGT